LLRRPRAPGLHARHFEEYYLRMPLTSQSEDTAVIARRWLSSLRADAEAPSAARLADCSLTDSVREVLREILSAASGGPDGAGRGRGAAERHGRERAQQEFEAAELMREYQLLRAELFRLLAERQDGIGNSRSPCSCAAAGRALDEAVLRAVSAFAEERTAELKRLSLTDALTGLHNRRCFYERLSEEIKRATRNRGRLTVALLDLDDFKGVNDLGGHPHGDRVLREAAAVIRGALRGTDIVCRYGGDEFGVILPETGAEDAHGLMERVRSAVVLLGTGRAVPPHFGVSCGAAEFPSDGRDADTLVCVADGRLMAAKPWP
jgi:diguanylate cyclase (GGDEF)-like protein